MTKEDLYYRYFSEINEFTMTTLANMTQRSTTIEKWPCGGAHRRDHRRDPRAVRSRTTPTPNSPCWCVPDLKGGPGPPAAGK
ncbi:hypothetical protein M8494_01170 [Serratia ureilytica]